jgi:hypothetical protein
MAAATPARAQARKLRSLLRTNATTAFGREHGFDRVDSVGAFQDRVPIRRFDELSPWVERIANGEANVLTAEPVRMMERTSGSTSANKLIPFTRTFLDEVAAATHPWLFDLFRHYPGLRGRRSYWSISPAAREKEVTSGGIPIGIDDDTEYFGRAGRWLLGSMMAVPARVGRITDIHRWRWETCRQLLGSADLGFISVWSPTFLTGLMEFLEDHLDELLASLEPSRAAAMRDRIHRGRGAVTAEALWPGLALVSCWTDGPSRAFVAGLRRWFPHTPLQPKGLLATEGAVSFPLASQEGSVLSVRGHFLEFLDPEHPGRRPLLAHELRVGDRVSPILTTGGGLVRYHLQDVVRCVGRYRATPCVRFEERLDCVSDLAGEKLDATVVGKAIEQAAQRIGIEWPFAMLAPHLGPPPGYRLYLEGAASDLVAQEMADALESALLAGAHYAYCRKLGQLDAVSLVRVSGGTEALERRRAAEGGRLGDLKPSPLDPRTGWDEFFSIGRRSSDLVRGRT